MTSVLVVGSRGSGLTTFVGLLYTAQVRLATEVGGTFRFHADRESLRQLDSLYADLGSGQFPRRDVDWERHSLGFRLGFRSRPWPLPFRRRRGDEGGDGSVRVRVGGIDIEEAAQLREENAILGESMRRVLDCQIVIALLDMSRLPSRDDEPASPLQLEEDAQLAATFDLAGTFRAVDPVPKARTLYPIFVLTKLDRCPGARVARWGAPTTAFPRWTLEERDRVGRGLLESHWPAVHRWLATRGGKSALSVAPARWFGSSVRLEPSGDGGLRIARRSRAPLGSWEPEYPYEEYRGLLEHLGRLGERLPSREERPDV